MPSHEHKNYLYVANWKMYWDFQQTTTYIQEHAADLSDLSSKEACTIVIAPSMSALHEATKLLTPTPIKTAAQDCSDQKNGAFTGQISAQDLASMSVSYCIIGHSERRQWCHETNTVIANKFNNLIDAGITPIVCIGESTCQKEQGSTLSVLKEQINWLTAQTPNNLPLIIAYEPVWAIGTGKVPTLEELTTIFTWLKKELSATVPASNITLLYGGSVNGSTVVKFKACSLIDGFLIGGASLKFEEFATIIRSKTND